MSEFSPFSESSEPSEFSEPSELPESPETPEFPEPPTLSEKILALALSISGVNMENNAECELLKSLCESAETAWTSRLRSDISPETCGGAFLCAVAFTAVAHLAASRSNQNIASFTAGNLSIQTQSSSENAAMKNGLRLSAEELMAPFTTPSDFCFRRTPG